MAKVKEKTKEIIATVSEIETLVGQASAYIDTSEQFKIRALLESAIRKCQDIRNMYDPT